MPVLLTTGDGTLSPATRSALQATAVNNLIVLGGPARIPDVTVNEAQSLTGAAVVRIAGADRYATAVQMAERLGGWWPTGNAADSAGSMVCLAASGGQGSNSVGWPDALGAGPLCAALNGAAANPGAPARALPPSAGRSPTVSAGTRPARDAVPVLLVTPQADDLPTSTRTFLASVFPTSSWCSSASVVPGCTEPGFAVAFGGRAVVSDGALLGAASLVSGGTYLVPDDLSPSVSTGFTTSLDLSPVFASGGGLGPTRECYPRAALSGVRWLSVYADSAATQFDSELDVMTSGRYVSDADGVSRTPGASAPVCVLFGGSSQNLSLVGGVSLSGRTTARTSLSYGPLQRMTLSTGLAQSDPTGSGAESDSTLPAVGTTWIYSGAPLAPVTITVKAGAPQVVMSATLNVTVTRGADSTSPNTVAGTFSIATTSGVLNGTIGGEALLTGGAWHLHGDAVITSGTVSATAGSGGFTADITLGNPGTSDDTVVWNIDGVVS